ncbi:hypothetical protein SJX93_24120 [Streptomyces cyaneofuscatus]|uniref:hypothetical protein n=1 Tax=Streptomyces cyaneofuscatus TaxID=66883 RepID=UPI002D792894|nr:hypothetical protein [Streptomyces cyaneofuscatus]WRO14848.1 hypothetical protein SJX93_24120 [Streptomyces cyaneofuscatus]
MDGKARYTPRDLRHFFASTALANDVPIHELSRWLGHRSVKATVDIYGHLLPGAWERCREVLQRSMRPTPVLGWCWDDSCRTRVFAGGSSVLQGPLQRVAGGVTPRRRSGDVPRSKGVHSAGNGPLAFPSSTAQKVVRYLVPRDGRVRSCP